MHAKIMKTVTDSMEEAGYDTVDGRGGAAFVKGYADAYEGIACPTTISLTMENLHKIVE